LTASDTNSILLAVVTSKAFRYRVYPTPTQIERYCKWESALRWLWNLALEQRKMGYGRPRDERVFPTAFDQINELTELRKELPWLADVPRNVCAQLLVELDKAWQRCFKKIARAPRWKRKGRDFLGLTEPHPKAWRLEGTILRFPKLGNLRAIVHRPIEGKPKTCSLKRDGNQWFASIVCEVEVKAPTPKTEPVVAIDRGVTNVIADSDGLKVKSPRFYGKALRRLKRAQQCVSRRIKGSKNREKAKLRVANLQRQTRRQREDFTHRLSHDYAKSHGTVVIEDLKIGNMVKANRGLARGILDQGWGMLAKFLKYKLTREGGQLAEVPAAYSSQTCSACGCVDALSRKGEVFLCVHCGYRDHADVNASKVLKSRWNASAQPVESSCRLRAPRRNRKVVQPSKAQPQSSAL
jgi:putative transposase